MEVVTHSHANAIKIVPNSKLEGSWLAAACRLVFAVQEMSTTGQAPLIENDLSECVFTDAKLDTSRRHGGSQSMVPLFSSRATQRSDQQDDADVSTLVASVRSSLWDSDPLFASKLYGYLQNAVCLCRVIALSRTEQDLRIVVDDLDRVRLRFIS